MAVDAENLLHNDQPALGLASRFGQIGRERMSVSGFEFDEFAHFGVLILIGSKPVKHSIGAKFCAMVG